MKVLLSIKPEFVEEIQHGNKRYEYRKKRFKKEVTSVVVYSNKPVGKIVGEFTIGEILQGPPDEIWSLTSRYAGVPEEFFQRYFLDVDEALAIEIKEYKAYPKPIALRDITGHEKAPQSFLYIEDDSKLPDFP